MACNKLACGSGILLGLCLASWVIALGGLGAMNKLVQLYSTGYMLAEKLNLPQNETAPSSDVALCSRSWRWEWFCLFFQFALVASGLVVSFIPSRLPRARFPLANLLSVATVIIMVAINENITDVWYFWDNHKMFNEWAGVLQKLYMSAAALVAGWVLIVIFNIIWIGIVLDWVPEAKAQDEESATTKK